MFSNIFNRWFNIFLFINSLGLFGYFFKFTKVFLRFGIGSIFSTLGILWSESLQSISYLKSFAYLVKDWIEMISDIKIPSIKDSNNLPDDTNSVGLSILGLIILGIVGSIALLCITDYFYPGNINSIPYLGDFIHSINIKLTSIFDWCFSNGDDGSGNNSLGQIVEVLAQVALDLI